MSIWTVYSPPIIFRKIVETERLPLLLPGYEDEIYFVGMTRFDFFSFP